MADVLTHLFLPLTAVYVLWPERFPSPAYLLLGAFGLLADLDKLLGHPGLLHSLLTLAPIAIAVLLVERWALGRLVLGPVIAALILSHLVLDVVDGGPVPLLYPLVREGIGLQYPAQVTFGTGPLGLTLDGPLVAIRTAVPRPGFNTYGFVDGFGVTCFILFGTVYAVGRYRGAGTADAAR